MVVRVRVLEIRVHLNPDPTWNVSGFEKLQPGSALLMHPVQVEPVPDNPGLSGSGPGPEKFAIPRWGVVVQVWVWR